ncbi:MAG: hypothetical protein MKZ95_05230 [Pirellulales bacterium]|nr:hypothetical protein [Pirellulales bacterium]|mmetsp:Transcript_18469/g.55190  ORF Transcript_18469/g.55190 Transcript_18469/m.55190 type:complete len:141 (+) Transcript_18469:1850-2272(+)
MILLVRLCLMRDQCVNFQTMSFTASGLASRIVSQMRTEAKTTALQCTEGFKTHSRATGFRGFLKLSVTVLGPNDVQQAHDLDAEYQKELVEEVGYGVDGMVKPNFTMCNLCQRAYLCRILYIVGRPLTWSFLSGKLRIST